jgi:hypothetical protein
MQASPLAQHYIDRIVDAIDMEAKAGFVTYKVENRDNSLNNVRIVVRNRDGETATIKVYKETS